MIFQAPHDKIKQQAVLFIMRGKRKMSLIWDYFSYMFFYSLLGAAGYALIIYIKYSKVGKKAGSQHLNDVMKKELPKLLLTAYCVGIIAVTVFRYIMIWDLGFTGYTNFFIRLRYQNEL